MVGIRLDSGDLAHLSIEARKLLDAAGFPQAVIVATNDLDERIIESLKQQGAKIAVWGVGTKLVTAYDQPALGGVYKLGALRDGQGDWQPKIKLSEQIAKSTIPGILQVRRFETSNGFVADMIYDETTGIHRDHSGDHSIVDFKDPTRRKHISAEAVGADLLEPVIRAGKPLADPEPLTRSRQRTAEELAKLHPGTRRFLNPHEYPVGLEIGLHNLRDQLIRQAREATATASQER
jgi:nicotinate phosphoribosyltransferase